MSISTLVRLVNNQKTHVQKKTNEITHLPLVRLKALAHPGSVAAQDIVDGCIVDEHLLQEFGHEYQNYPADELQEVHFNGMLVSVDTELLVQDLLNEQTSRQTETANWIGLRFFEMLLTPNGEFVKA